MSGCSLGGEPPIVATIPPAAIPATRAVEAPAATDEVSPSGTQEASVQPTVLPDVKGSAKGQITNGTRGGSVPANLEVELHSFASHFGQTINNEMVQGKADATGQFTFSEVNVSAAKNYFAAVKYGNRYYTSEIVVGNPSEPVLDLPITIYEITSDPTVLNVGNLVTQVSPMQGGLYVVQIIRFENSSDRLFITDEKVADAPEAIDAKYASVRIALPTGAQLLGFANGDTRYVVKDGAVIDTEPVLPNERHIVHYRYLLPYVDQGTITLPLPFRIEGDVTLMVNPSNLEVTAQTGSEPIAAQGVQAMGGTEFKIFSSTLNMPTGTTFTFSFKGSLPTIADAGISANGGGLVAQPFAIGLIVGGALMIVIGVALLLRGQRKGSKAAEKKAARS